MTEKRLWEKIRAAWPGHCQRVEASLGEAQSGTPDGVLSVSGRGAWVELKVWPEPLRPLQLPWHQDALQRGAAAYVLCWMYDKSQKLVWLGSAEDYAWLIEVGNKPPATHCRLLSNALAEIRFNLTHA